MDHSRRFTEIEFDAISRVRLAFIESEPAQCVLLNIGSLSGPKTVET